MVFSYSNLLMFEIIINSLCYSLQSGVFNQLGAGVLNNAWQGYNSTLFAYGQTGSGKSYSIVGFGANKGEITK